MIVARNEQTPNVKNNDIVGDRKDNLKIPILTNINKIRHKNYVSAQR